MYFYAVVGEINSANKSENSSVDQFCAINERQRKNSELDKYK